MLLDFLAMRESTPSLNTQPIIYTGTGAARTIATGVNLATGGAVLVRRRNAAESTAVFDTVRGISRRKRIEDSYNAEDISSALTVGDQIVTLLGAAYNVSGATYVTWLLRKLPGFFTAVPFTRLEGVSTYAHDLGTAPGAVLVLRRTGSNAFPANSDGRMVPNGGTSTTFSVPASVANGDFVALLFGNDGERVACGSVEGTGAAQDVVFPFAPSLVIVFPDEESANRAGPRATVVDVVRGAGKTVQFGFGSESSSGGLAIDGDTLHITGAAITSDPFNYIALR